MSVEDNKAMYRRLIEEGFNRGDDAIIDEIMSPDFVEHEPIPVQASGREGVRQYFAMMRSASPDFHITIENVLGEGDLVAARVTARGTQTGLLMGIPPTGKQVTLEVMDLCRFAGGRMVEHWGVGDNLGMMQQLGVIPASMPGH